MSEQINKVIGLQRSLSNLEMMASNVLPSIINAVNAKTYDVLELLDEVHGEMFYVVGLAGTINIAKSMEIEMTPNGYLFKETPLEHCYSDDDSVITEYVHETLRRLAAQVANREYDLSPLSENCELFITMLSEALDELSE